MVALYVMLFASYFVEKHPSFIVSIFSVGVKDWFLPSNLTPIEKIETAYQPSTSLHIQ